MEKVKIIAQERLPGKSQTKRLKRQGYIPAIIYGKNVNIPLALDKDAFKVLNKIKFSETAIINLEIKNGENKRSFMALIKGIQRDIITNNIIHLDFMQFSLEDKIRVHIPIIFKGEPAGVKEGGILEKMLREVEIEGVVSKIPQSIEVDVSSLGIAESLHIEDLKIPPDLKIITNPKDTVATVVVKKEEEVPAEEAEAAAEEPEVLKEKKEEKKESE